MFHTIKNIKKYWLLKYSIYVYQDFVIIELNFNWISQEK